MGWFSDALFGKRKELDTGMISQYMQPAQDLVTQQGDLAGQFTDFDSLMNRQMRNFMAQQSQTQGQQIGGQMQKMGAMGNVSPAQAMMQARMGMNQAMGQGSGQMMCQQFQNMQYGGSLLGQAAQNQTGLSENLANAYMSKINAHNRRRSTNIGNMFGLAGAAMMGGLAGRGPA